MVSASIREIAEPQLELFLPLFAEIELGAHFRDGDPEHASWLKQTIAVHIANGAHFYGSWTDAGEPLGVVGIAVSRKIHCTASAEIVDIGVTASHRRRGLGTALLRHAAQVAAAEGVHAVYARTYAADTDTIAFYGRNAFYPVAVIPGTDGPTDEGDIVMRRRLSGEAA